MSLPKPGDWLLGKYLLQSRLGEGGMGVVYSARHELLNQRVAVKFLLPAVASNPDAVTRFVNEARAAARIESDHVARVLDVGLLEDSVPYMVLELLDGDDLGVVLEKHGPRPVAEVADHLLQAIEALAHAHVLGIVHRDLKPANLFLARRADGTARVKVLDFGISKILGSAGGDMNLTKTDAVFGSPLYMSPEQLRNSKNVDHLCDIWALGVIAYELLTGDMPFMGDNSVALFAAINESNPVPLRARQPHADIPLALEHAVLRCLRRTPSERFASVTELGASLAPFATEAGRRALENARRILPLALVPTLASPQTTRSLTVPIPVSTGSSPAISTSAPAPFVRGPITHGTDGTVYANTANPWATSNASLTPPPKSRALMMAILAFGTLGVVAAAAGGYALSQRHSKQGAASSAQVPVASASIVAPVATPPSAATATATSATPPPTTTSAAIAVAPPPQAPSIGRPKGGVAPATAAAPAGSARVPPVAAPPPASPGINCDPPYTINSAGHHVLKPECQ